MRIGIEDERDHLLRYECASEVVLNEARSDDVERYIQDHGPVAISELTVVEMRCLLGRWGREKNIDSKIEAQVFVTFQDDMRQGFLICHPLPKNVAAGSVNLLPMLADVPLRMLNVLHPMVAKEIQTDILATADKIMAMGGKLMGFAVMRFD